jgi:hypothetical protein
MLTDMPIYFVLLLVTAMFGFWLGVKISLWAIACVGLLVLWSHIRHPRSWKGNGYAVVVEQGFREQAWIVYKRAGLTLTLNAEWQDWGDGLKLGIFAEGPLYLAPDYKSPLSERDVAVVREDISKALDNLKIAHDFVSLSRMPR